MLKDYVSVDLEMSGLNPREDRIIEIGAVKVTDGQVRERFSVLINPHRKISEEIISLTGLTNEMLAEGLEDWEGVGQFMEFAGDLPLVGHHIVSDIGFLKTCAVNHKKNMNNLVVDTLDIARKILPPEQKKNLKALCQLAGISYRSAHRATEDAEMTHKLLVWLGQQPGAKQEWFEPRELVYKVKKQCPITKNQIRQLKELMEYHGIQSDIEIGSLTKNEASRKIDKILFNYGRIPKV